MNSDSPDLREHAFKIAAQDSFNFRIAVLAANQAFGQIKHSFRVIEPFNIDLLTEAVTAFVPGAESFVELGRHSIVAVKVDVTAHAEMLRPNQFLDVIEVVQNVVHCCRLVSFDKHSHARNSDDAASLSNLLDRLISFQTRMTRHEGTTV